MKRRVYDVGIGMMATGVMMVILNVMYNGAGAIDFEDEIVEYIIAAGVPMIVAMVVGLPMFVGVVTIIDLFKSEDQPEEEEEIEKVQGEVVG